MLPVSLAVTALVEKSQGRTLLGNNDKFRLLTTETDGKYTSQALIDPYSITHFEHGLYYYVLLTYFNVPYAYPVALGIESLWEMFENSNWGINRYRSVGYTYQGDSILNSLADIMFMAFGFRFANQYITNIGNAALLALIIDSFVYFIWGDSLLLTMYKFIAGKSQNEG